MAFSQKDPAWKNIKLGTGNLNLGQAGCLIVSYCNLLVELDIIKLTPEDLNDLCIRKGFYSNGDMLILPKLAEYFKLTYKKQIEPSELCILETDYYKNKGVPQHFTLYRNRKIIDPLDLPCNWKSNKYPAVSYRVFTRLSTPPLTPIPTEPEKPVLDALTTPTNDTKPPQEVEGGLINLLLTLWTLLKKFLKKREENS